MSSKYAILHIPCMCISICKTRILNRHCQPVFVYQWTANSFKAKIENCFLCAGAYFRRLGNDSTKSEFNTRFYMNNIHIICSGSCFSQQFHNHINIILQSKAISSLFSRTLIILFQCIFHEILHVIEKHLWNLANVFTSH